MQIKTSTIIALTILGVALIAAVTVLLIWGPHDWPTQLATAGTAIITMAGGAYAAWRRLPDSDGDGAPDFIDPPSSGAGIALLFVAASCIAAQGCGGQAWEAHAYTALTLRDVSNEANETLRDAHRDYLRTRGATAETPADLAALSQRWREEHSEVLHTQRATAELTNAYARGVMLALRGEGVDFNQILRVGVDAARGLLAIGQMMADHGIDWVNEVPPWVLDLLGVESAGEEGPE